MDLLSQLSLTLAYKETCKYFSLQFTLSKLKCSLLIDFSKTNCVDPKEFSKA